MVFSEGREGRSCPGPLSWARGGHRPFTSSHAFSRECLLHTPASVRMSVVSPVGSAHSKELVLTQSPPKRSRVQTRPHSRSWGPGLHCDNLGGTVTPRALLLPQGSLGAPHRVFFPWKAACTPSCTPLCGRGDHTRLTNANALAFSHRHTVTHSYTLTPNALTCTHTHTHILTHMFS